MSINDLILYLDIIPRSFQKWWHVTGLLFFRNFYISKIIKIQTMISMTPNKTTVGVSLFLEMIWERCWKVFYPGKYLSVDFKCRVCVSCISNVVSVCQSSTSKTKRARFRTKLYDITSSDGITLDLLVYSDKGMFDMHMMMMSTVTLPKEWLSHNAVLEQGTHSIHR